MIIAILLGSHLYFALRSRKTLDGAEHLTLYAARAPIIIAAWHECPLLMPTQWRTLARWDHCARPVRRMHVLVSRSRHGRLIPRVLRRFGVEVVFGSSSRATPPARATRSGFLTAATRSAAHTRSALSSAPSLPCAAQTTRQS
jgi:lysophospholipid acyltransferase (LPLAT)-like uncharacterized protein